MLINGFMRLFTQMLHGCCTEMIAMMGEINYEGHVFGNEAA